MDYSETLQDEESDERVDIDGNIEEFDFNEKK